MNLRGHAPLHHPGIQLAPLVDVVDLDGHLLNANDAVEGLGFVDGAVLPGDGPGLGVTPLEPWP